MDRLISHNAQKLSKPTSKMGVPAITTYRAIGKIVMKFEETEVVTNIERPVHNRFACYAENIAIVNESNAEDPNVSILRRSQELGLSYSTLWRISHLDIHLHPYKVQLIEQQKLADHSQWRRYLL